LAKALSAGAGPKSPGGRKLAKFSFPLNLNATTRRYFERAAELETPQTAADIRAVLAANPDPAALARLSENVAYNAQLRTTRVATMLEGGHAMNALPQTARATVSHQPVLSAPSALDEELLSTIEKTSEEFWPPGFDRHRIEGTNSGPGALAGNQCSRNRRRNGIIYLHHRHQPALERASVPFRQRSSASA
jgi:hypothetical protein